MNNLTTDSINRQRSIATQAGQTGKMALIIIASSLLFTPAAQAFEAKISGQVSRMVVAPDDAVGDEIQHVDIGYSGSRFRFTGSETMDNGNEVGFRFEIQARDNSAGDVDGSTINAVTKNFDFRYQDLYFSGGFGKIALGKGDGASNGSTEVDFSGTGLSSSSNHQDNWGNYKITAGGTPIPWKDVFTMFDGLSRQNRVRYDTPNFNGFSFAGSINQGNASELAIRYRGDFGSSKFGAALFSATDTDANARDVTGGSASFKMSSGLNFTVAFSESDPDVGPARDATTFKVGYKKGMHAYSIDVGEGDNGTGGEGDTTGFTWAYFPHPGVEVFATWRELDSTGVPGAQSVDLLAFGGRVKF